MADNEAITMDRWSLQGRFDWETETERRLQLLSDVYGMAGLEKAIARRAAIHDLATLEEDRGLDRLSLQEMSEMLREPALTGAASGWQCNG